jgi:cellulose biosynthesis protein BcsQ
MPYWKLKLPDGKQLDCGMKEELRAPMVFSDADDKGGIIHVANIKGGVGKSTLATNLTASLSKRGSVLLIDLDVQGSAGVALGVDEADTRYTSWDFFKRRFSTAMSVSQYVEMMDVGGLFSKLEEIAIGGVVGSGSVDDTIVKVSQELHVVPAGPGLFNAPTGQQYGNFLHNLSIVKERYKYIVIDTPSVWNRLTRFLYVNCDLNLIPVTLDALSTKSFKEYLVHIKRLVAHNSHVRLRIVKNEVSRDDDTKPDGKTRTINLNRRFLDSLCEQAAVHNDCGVALLPQSIMFDLEIPESTAIREAQDEGKSVHDHGGDKDAVKAFDLLAKNVQHVLNGVSRENIAVLKLERKIMLACKLCAAILIVVAISLNRPIHDIVPPRPIAPQQVMESGASAAFTHTFARGDNIVRLAKHAISRFRGMVPTQRQIVAYIRETVDAYNMTRLPHEPKILDLYRVPIGTTLTFYPPMAIANKDERRMVPAYRFFMDMVDDAFPYVTGDWCERGTGGGQPHYAIDVAAAYGSEILSPVDGIAAWKNDPNGGRTVAVLFNGAMISFSHLNQRHVREGDSVRRGQPIGTIGMTGRTTGPHVHISYGIRSMSRHDITFGRGQSFRFTDPKFMYYKMAYGESDVEEY